MELRVAFILLNVIVPKSTPFLGSYGIIIISFVDILFSLGFKIFLFHFLISDLLSPRSVFLAHHPTCDFHPALRLRLLPSTTLRASTQTPASSCKPDVNSPWVHHGCCQLHTSGTELILCSLVARTRPASYLGHPAHLLSSLVTASFVSTLSHLNPARWFCSTKAVTVLHSPLRAFLLR